MFFRANEHFVRFTSIVLSHRVRFWRAHQIVVARMRVVLPARNACAQPKTRGPHSACFDISCYTFITMSASRSLAFFHSLLALAVAGGLAFVLPGVSDPLGTGKLVWIGLLVGAAAVMWLWHLRHEHHVPVWRGVANWAGLVVLFFLVLSAWRSGPTFTTWMGPSDQPAEGLIAWVLFFLLFFLVQTFSHHTDHQVRLSRLLVWLGIVLPAVALVAVLSPFVLSDANDAAVLNLVGSWQELSVVLAVLAVFSLSFGATRAATKIDVRLARISALTSFGGLLVIDDSASWVVFLVAGAWLCSWLFVHAAETTQRIRTLPIVFLLLGLLAWLLPPVMYSGVPTELALHPRMAMEIGRSALEGQSRWFGAGPGRYAEVFDAHRPVSFNGTSYWEARFDHAGSAALTWLPTLGIATLIALGVFAAFVWLTWWNAQRRAGGKEMNTTFPFSTLFLSTVVAIFVSTWNLSLLVFMAASAGMLMARLHEQDRRVRTPRAQALVHSVSWASSLPIFVLMAGLLEHGLAEVVHADALGAARDSNPQRAYVLADRAAALNQWNAAYQQTLLEQQRLALGQLLSVPEPDAQAVETVSQGLVLSAQQVAALAPTSAVAWAQRGAVYQELMRVLPEAAVQAQTSYKEAIARAPNRPEYWMELGRVQLQQAELERPQTKSDDVVLAAAAQQKMQETFGEAQSAFVRALELKADYAPAHYQMALLYERQGDLGSAIGKLESVRRYNPNDVGVLFQLGVLYLQRNAFDDTMRAEQTLTRALSIAPSYANALWYLATVKERQGDPATAVALLERLQTLQPEQELVKSRLERLRAGN